MLMFQPGHDFGVTPAPPVAAFNQKRGRDDDVRAAHIAKRTMRRNRQTTGSDQRARLDALFRDTVVYLTCVHELGHALGLSHTAEFEDIMYFFGFGGDIGEFFDRYRRRLEERADIRAASAISPGDLRQLSALYGPKPIPGQLTVLN